MKPRPNWPQWLRLRTMSAREFVQHTTQLGFNQADTAEFLGCDVRTVRRYESGATIPEPTVMLLRAVAYYDALAMGKEEQK